MKQLTDTCYLDEEKMLSVVQPVGYKHFIVINKKAALLYGPAKKEACFNFVEKYEDA